MRAQTHAHAQTHARARARPHRYKVVRPDRTDEFRAVWGEREAHMRGRKGLVSFELRETAPRVFEVEHVWETRADWEAWLNDRYARAHVCEGVRTRARSQERTTRARARIRANTVLTTSTTFSLAHARARACVCVRVGALFSPRPCRPRYISNLPQGVYQMRPQNKEGIPETFVPFLDPELSPN